MLVSGVRAGERAVQRGAANTLARSILAPGARLDACGLCNLQDEDGHVCTRLCSDLHCAVCRTFSCSHCMGHDDEPECEHECSRCTYVGEGLEDCANANCEQARGDNGFCPVPQHLSWLRRSRLRLVFRALRRVLRGVLLPPLPGMRELQHISAGVLLQGLLLRRQTTWLSSDDEEEEEEQIEYY